MNPNNDDDDVLPYAPSPIPISELKKWNGLSHLDSARWLSRIKLAFIFNKMAAFVTVEDEVYTVGQNEHGSLGTGDGMDFFFSTPVHLPILSGKRICDFAFSLQKILVRGGPPSATNGNGNCSPRPGPSRSKKGVMKKKVGSYFALTVDQKVYGWGYNGDGNLGLNGRRDVNPVTPVKLSLPDECQIIKLACGSGHTLALSIVGTIWAWGRNNFGQVGNGNVQNHPFPVEIRIKNTGGGPNEFERVNKIACGYNHSAAVTANGRVYTWGHDDRGQLGQCVKDPNNFMPTPTLVGALMGENIRQVACGKHHTLAMSEDWKLWVWGSNNYGQLGNCSVVKSRIPIRIDNNPDCFPPGTTVREIAAVAHQAVSVCKTRINNGPVKVYMWGSLPHVTAEKAENLPTDKPWDTFMTNISDIFSSYLVPPTTHETIRVPPQSQPRPAQPRLLPPPDLMKWNGLKYVSPEHLQNIRFAFVVGTSGSGWEQTAMLISTDDRVSFVGKNVFGSFGLGESENTEYRTPVVNPILSGKSIKYMDYGLDRIGGAMCLFALSEHGTIYSWGYNEYGEMGTGTRTPKHLNVGPATPTRIEGLLRNEFVTTLACGSDHTFAITSNQELFSWGYNYYGQLGYSSGNQDACLSPRKVTDFPRPVKIARVAGGMFHSVAVTTDGHVFSWGCNEQHQLGVVTANRHNFTPHRVVFPSHRSAQITKVVCGPNCTLALSYEGEVFFWGRCEIANNEACLPIKVDGFDPHDPIIDVETAHWAQIYACKATSGKIYMWGSPRGKDKLILIPQEVHTATSIDDVFAFYSNPPSMIRPLTRTEGENET